MSFEGFIGLLEKYFPVIKNYPSLLALFLIVLFSLLKYKSLFEFKDYLKNREVEQLERALSNKHVSKDVKEFISDKLSEKYFYTITGFNISRPCREDLIRIYQKNNIAVDFIHFKRASSFINFNQGKVEKVKIPWPIELLWLISIMFSELLILLTISFIFQIDCIINSHIVKQLLPYNIMIGKMVSVVIFFPSAVALISQVYMQYKSSRYVSRQIGANDKICYYVALRNYFLEKFTIKYKKRIARWVYHVVLILPIPILLFIL